MSKNYFSNINALGNLKVNTIDENSFVRIVLDTVGCSQLALAFEYGEPVVHENFAWFRDQYEWHYIIHLHSGMMVRWHKYIGRLNACSQDSRTAEDLRKFFEMFKEELDSWEESH